MEINNEIIRAVNNVRLKNTDSFIIHWFKVVSIKDGKTAVTRKEHHHNFIEIHFFLNGYCKYRIDGETITVAKDQFLLIPELENHTVVDISDDFTKLAVGFELTAKGADCVCKYIYSDFTDEVNAFVDYTAKHAMSPDAFSDELIRNKAFETLLDILYRDAKRPKRAEEPTAYGDLRLIKAKDFIADNITAPLRCEDVAGYCYLSQKQLNRIFLKEEGMTVVGYIHSVRMKTAKELLEDTDMSLRQISERAGFCNEYYFSRFFKEHIGMTPNEYRLSLNKSAK